MLFQFKKLIKKFIIQPANDLLDVTTFIITNPAQAGKVYAVEDRAISNRVITYFIAAFSASIVLNKIGFVALGIEVTNEVLYWALHAGLISCITLLVIAFAAPLRPAPFTLFVKMSFLAYGAAFLISSFILAGAALTLAGLRKIGYITDFKKDFISVSNFEDIAMYHNYQCLREESILYDILYSGMGGAFERLQEPVASFSYILPFFLVAGALLFGVLTFFGASKRRWAASIAPLIGSVITFAGFLLGLSAYNEYLYQTTQCTKHGIESGQKITAESQIAKYTNMLSKDIGEDGKALVLTGVEQKQHSVILRLRAKKHPQGIRGFNDWVNRKQRRMSTEFCTSKSGLYFQKLGMTQISLIRYMDTDRVERIVQSADQCVK